MTIIKTQDFAHLKTTSHTKPSKRGLIIEEILSTERTYLKCLSLIHSHYRAEMIKRYPSSIDLIIRLFDQVDTLTSVNACLLSRLEERVYNSGIDLQFTCIGDIFCTMSQDLKIYSLFAKHFSTNMDLLRQLQRKHTDLTAFLCETSKLPECQQLSLQALMITPIQRIPRYKLLLEQLCKATSATHLDNNDLHTAVRLIDEVAQFVNDAIRENEMYIKLVQLDKSLIGYDLLSVQDRTLVHTGWLDKICRKANKRYLFILCSDVLIYARQSVLDTLIFHRELSLRECAISDVPSDDQRSFAFIVHHPQKSFTLLASSMSEKQTWLLLLCKSCKPLADVESLNEVETPTRTLAPVWLPDDAAPKCMICDAKFSLFLRRHHCRACGSIICSQCSSHVHLLLHTSFNNLDTEF